jgi:rare lipoprotein A (peptidoglycan hydrolase)
MNDQKPFFPSVIRTLRPLLILLPVLLVSCASQAPKTVKKTPAADGANATSGDWVTIQTGTASWYGGYWHKRLTANGERYDQNSMTAAHRVLPFNTKVRVTNLSTGRSCFIRVNNRGPYIKGRIMDLSVAAAKAIGSHGAGLAKVRLEVEKGTRAAGMSESTLNPPMRWPKR